MLNALWSARTWRATSHLVTGVVLGPLGLVATLVLSGSTLVLAPTVVGGALALWLLLAASRLFTRLQRSRFAAVLGRDIPPPVRAVGNGPVRQLVRDLRELSTWRRLAYHVVAGIQAPVAGLLVIGTWSTGLALAPAIAYGDAWVEVSFLESAALTVAGLAALLAAPWVARGLAWVDAEVAYRMLGTSRSEELSHQVSALAASREGVVDAADAERRRIERDLHDGAQQRLTSLAVNLGIARTTLTDLPDPAQRAIAEAHDEAKLALAELRDLVRGLHPAVLDDRGLDAALSGVAARSPVPVRLDVALAARASSEIEAVAYFVVSEALTNATAHAEAARVDVTIEQVGDRLRVAVADDGRGGADPAAGTGLRGLHNRVRSVDGTLRIESPPGGPTEIIAELPCES